jgi:hypothetical protein
MEFSILGYECFDSLFTFVLKSLTSHFFPDSISNIYSPLNLCFRQYQGKLLTAVSCRDIIGAAKIFYGRCKTQKNVIPFLMAVGVLTFLKWSISIIIKDREEA